MAGLPPVSGLGGVGEIYTPELCGAVSTRPQERKLLMLTSDFITGHDSIRNTGIAFDGIYLT